MNAVVSVSSNSLMNNSSLDRSNQLLSLFTDFHTLNQELSIKTDSLFSKALSLFQQECFSAAENAFLELLTLSPDNITYSFYLAAIWYQTGKYQEALNLFCSLFHKTGSESSLKPKTLVWCALCLSKLHREIEAEACYAQAKLFIK